MLLHDSLQDAVADVTADVPALTSAARRRGTILRRRRRTATALGSVAAVAVLATVGWAALPGAEPDPVGVDVPFAAPSVAPLSGATAPTTSRGVAAALAATVEDVADGTFGRFQGDVFADEGYEPESSAALLFEPAGGTGPAGQVFLNLQPLAMAGERPYSCDSRDTDCRVHELPNGDTLRTYREDDDSEFGAGSQRAVAEVISPTRQLRVLISARNSNPWSAGEFRERTVLTTDQLTAIARLPWWSRTELPVEYVEAGAALTDYTGADEG